LIISEEAHAGSRFTPNGLHGLRSRRVDCGRGVPLWNASNCFTSEGACRRKAISRRRRTCTRRTADHSPAQGNGKNLDSWFAPLPPFFFGDTRQGSDWLAHPRRLIGGISAAISLRRCTRLLASSYPKGVIKDRFSIEPIGHPTHGQAVLPALSLACREVEFEQTFELHENSHQAWSTPAAKLCMPWVAAGLHQDAMKCPASRRCSDG
jgi:hypothetical protein